jgi:WD40 repeat protein
MTCSIDSLRVWDLDSGLQLGDNWQERKGIMAIALSPDGKKIVGGSWSAVKLWDIDTGKVMSEWTGHTGCEIGLLEPGWWASAERIP